MDFKIAENDYPKLTPINIIRHEAQLDMLEYLVGFINNLRESLTQELIANDVPDEDILKQRLETIKKQLEDPKNN
tara:strand:+ start:168 stop:392 length:225 start_codon:yes stop_codon:yes gene_type:complete